MTDLTLSVTKTVNAPIEKVFDAWLNADLLSQFILPAPGMPNPEVTTDGTQGGSFTIIMQVGEDKIPHNGKYLEISRPSRLEFTWESPFSPEGSTVTLEFSSESNNRTLVNLTQVKFLNEEARDNHQGGWGTILDKLDELVA